MHLLRLWTYFPPISSCLLQPSSLNAVQRHVTRIHSLLLRRQPLDDIRDYFGGSVAMYFSWMAMYTRSLVVASAVGLMSFLTQTFMNLSVDENPFTIYYSVFFSVWSITFLSAWKQRENENAFLWGAEGYTMYESPRPQFKGKHIINPITGRETVEYDAPCRRYTRLIISQTISFGFLLLCSYFAVQATELKYSDSTLIADKLAATFEFAGGPGSESGAVYHKPHIVHSVVNWQLVSAQPLIFLQHFQK